MRLTSKYSTKNANEKTFEAIRNLQWHVAKLYNIILYDLLENNININFDRPLNLIQTEIYDLYKDNWHREHLHSHTYQQAIIMVVQDFKSYLEAKKEYAENPSKFTGEPRRPRFKKAKDEEKLLVTFTKYAIRRENSNIILSLSKAFKKYLGIEEKGLKILLPKKVIKRAYLDAIKMVRLRIENNQISILFIYETTEEKIDKTFDNVMAIDLGLNNIVAMTNAKNINSIIISGKEVKSKNKYYNDKIAHYQGIEMKKTKDSKKYTQTKRIDKLYRKRGNFMHTFMHKVSKQVIDYAMENKCNTIVIGDLNDIKRNMKNNSNFVQVPIKKLVSLIEYKAKLKGIDVQLISERYTSGVSFLDGEEITEQNYDKTRRIHRGLFISNKGIRINSDINGSLNILKKYLIKQNSKLASLLIQAKGWEQHPRKIRIR